MKFISSQPVCKITEGISHKLNMAVLKHVRKQSWKIFYKLPIGCFRDFTLYIIYNGLPFNLLYSHICCTELDILLIVIPINYAINGVSTKNLNLWSTLIFFFVNLKIIFQSMHSELQTLFRKWSISLFIFYGHIQFYIDKIYAINTNYYTCTCLVCTCKPHFTQSKHGSIQQYNSMCEIVISVWPTNRAFLHHMILVE
jgi:hypothetical protein